MFPDPAGSTTSGGSSTPGDSTSTTKEVKKKLIFDGASWIEEGKTNVPGKDMYFNGCTWSKIPSGYEVDPDEGSLRKKQ